jgi:hypothetical protein
MKIKEVSVENYLTKNATCLYTNWCVRL